MAYYATPREDWPSLADVTYDEHIVDEDLEEPFSPEEEEMLPVDNQTKVVPDRHGNVIALDGCTRCSCGCKYWEHDRCIDCGGSPAEAV